MGNRESEKGWVETEEVGKEEIREGGGGGD